MCNISVRLTFHKQNILEQGGEEREGRKDGRKELNEKDMSGGKARTGNEREGGEKKKIK